MARGLLHSTLGKSRCDVHKLRMDHKGRLETFTVCNICIMLWEQKKNECRQDNGPNAIVLIRNGYITFATGAGEQTVWLAAETVLGCVLPPGTMSKNCGNCSTNLTTTCNEVINS